MSRELFLYKAEHLAELDSDLLEWWQTRKLAYPLVDRLVQKRFSMVATSFPQRDCSALLEMSSARSEVAYCPRMLTDLYSYLRTQILHSSFLVLNTSMIRMYMYIAYTIAVLYIAVTFDLVYEFCITKILKN